MADDEKRTNGATTRKLSRERRVRRRARRPPWACVFADLAAIWKHEQPRTPEDRDAWLLLWSALKHFGAHVDVVHGDITKEKIATAAKALRVPKTKNRVRTVLTYLDMRVDGSPQGFESKAQIIAGAFSVDSARVPELARMLANEIDAPRSGRVPSGKWTRAMIVRWITGEPYDDKEAGSQLRSRRPKRS